jgi:hypothetical protein
MGALFGPKGAAVTIVSGEARRRWLVVLLGIAVLTALPVVIAALPARTPAVDPAALRAKVLASASQPYHGYAVSSATLGLRRCPGSAPSPRC